jgi:hypothetical protein
MYKWGGNENKTKKNKKILQVNKNIFILTSGIRMNFILKKINDAKTTKNIKTISCQRKCVSS